MVFRSSKFEWIVIGSVSEGLTEIEGSPNDSSGDPLTKEEKIMIYPAFLIRISSFIGLIPL